MTKSYGNHGKIVHRPYSSYISSIGNLTGTLSSSPCQLRLGVVLRHLSLSPYNLINKRKVTAFVDDVLVGIETKEGHDEIVEEILKRLEENNLYIKLEKYIWKAREIGFLEVVIEPNGIEMEKEKMDGVLS